MCGAGKGLWMTIWMTVAGAGPEELKNRLSDIRIVSILQKKSSVDIEVESPVKDTNTAYWKLFSKLRGLEMISIDNHPVFDWEKLTKIYPVVQKVSDIIGVFGTLDDLFGEDSNAVVEEFEEKIVFNKDGRWVLFKDKIHFRNDEDKVMFALGADWD
jgi:hypothetical protein